MSKYLSVAIPTYECNGYGTLVLSHSFEILYRQNYKNFDITISDDSQNNDVMNLCKEWDNKLDIKYHKNKTRLGAALNTNSAIKKSIGKWIKVLCMDDYLYDEYSLNIIVDNLEEHVIWLFTDYIHTYDWHNYFRRHLPDINPQIFIRNTLGSPSAVTVKNINGLPEMDGNLSYAYDCDWYFRLFIKYGYPKLVRQMGMVNYLWDGSITSSISSNLIEKENKYILDKYGLKI